MSIIEAGVKNIHTYHRLLDALPSESGDWTEIETCSRDVRRSISSRKSIFTKKEEGIEEY